MFDKDGEMRFPPPVSEWDFNDCQYFAEYTNKSTPVMQYTGLKDKNGKEIYEGDILGSYGAVFTVIFEDGCFKWSTDAIGANNQIAYKKTGHFKNVGPFEVIGNIYENPELSDDPA